MSVQVLFSSIEAVLALTLMILQSEPCSSRLFGCRRRKRKRRRRRRRRRRRTAGALDWAHYSPNKVAIHSSCCWEYTKKGLNSGFGSIVICPAGGGCGPFSGATRGEVIRTVKPGIRHREHARRLNCSYVCIYLCTYMSMQMLCVCIYIYMYVHMYRVYMGICLPSTYTFKVYTYVYTAMFIHTYVYLISTYTY